MKRMTDVDATWRVDEGWPKGWGDEDSLLRALYAPVEMQREFAPSSLRTRTFRRVAAGEGQGEVGVFKLADSLAHREKALERVKTQHAVRRLYRVATTDVVPSRLKEKVEYPYVAISRSAEGAVSISSLAFPQYKDQNPVGRGVRRQTAVIAFLFVGWLWMVYTSATFLSYGWLSALWKNIEFLVVILITIGVTVRQHFAARSELLPATFQDAETFAQNICDGLIADGWEEVV